MNYEPKFVKDMTIEQIDAEIKEWHDDQYRYGRGIDWNRMHDLEYTKKVLNNKEENEMERIKAYWMATMAMNETREDMEQIWSTEEGMADLMDWYEGELEAGLTEEEMDKAIASVNANKEENEMKSMNFEINGVTFESNEKGNRFYKTVDGKKTRIGQAEFEEAMNTPTEIKNIPCENGDHIVEFAKMGDGYAVRLAGSEDFQPISKDEVKSTVDKRDGKFHAAFEFMGRRYWTRDAIVEGETKKTKKSSRSKKNAAYKKQFGEVEITLTEKQVDFFHHVQDTCFWEQGLDSTPWIDILCDEIGGQFEGKPMTVGAMVSTLREKNLLTVGVQRVNGRKAKFFELTDLGKEVAADLGLK